MWVDAALLYDDTAQSTDALELLVDSQLIDVVAVNPHGRPRFVFHDITRLFARELLADHQEDRDETTVLERVLAGWLARSSGRTARSTAATLPSCADPRLACGWPVGHMDSIVEDPLAWLDTERQNLLCRCPSFPSHRQHRQWRRDAVSMNIVREAEIAARRQSSARAVATVHENAVHAVLGRAPP